MFGNLAATKVLDTSTGWTVLLLHTELAVRELAPVLAGEGEV